MPLNATNIPHPANPHIRMTIFALHSHTHYVIDNPDP
jgi:hypothetical protein